MGLTTETRVDNLEHGSEEGRGPMLISIDAGHPEAFDAPPGAPRPRMFKTRAGAHRWLEGLEPDTPRREGEIQAVIVDWGPSGTPAGIRAKLKERKRREQEHAEALARQLEETREERRELQ